MAYENEETETSEQDEVVPQGAVCSVEEAERVIARWAKAMGLSSKLDESGLFPEEVSGLRKAMRDLRDAVLDGHLTLDSESRFVFTLYECGDADKKLGTMVFDEPDMGMLRKAKAERNGIAAQTKLLQGMTRKDEILIGRMKQRNVAVCGAIVNLFLG
jgi:phage gp29-like protein